MSFAYAILSNKQKKERGLTRNGTRTDKKWNRDRQSNHNSDYVIFRLDLDLD